MENRYKDWDLFLKKSEYPFVQDGMTPEEFDKELKYFGENYDKYREGKYQPLWKQKEGV